MATGAINGVRGTRSSDEELFKIYTYSKRMKLQNWGKKAALKENTAATEAALDKDGWFNTGDIGWIVIVGCAKDTIVLSTGENVDPKDLEEALLNSRLIHQIVVVGQDQRHLGAILVPNKDEMLESAKRLSILDEKMEIPKEKLLKLIYDEVRTWTACCTFLIGPILIIDEPFTVDNDLLWKERNNRLFEGKMREPRVRGGGKSDARSPMATPLLKDVLDICSLGYPRIGYNLMHVI